MFLMYACSYFALCKYKLSKFSMSNLNIEQMRQWVGGIKALKDPNS